MKTKTRNILIVISLVLLIFVGIIGYGVYKIFNFLNTPIVSRNVEVPAVLQDAKVLKGEDFLQKTEIFKLKQQTFAEVIAKGSQIKDEKDRERITRSETAKGIYGFDDLKICGNEIIAVGKFGGYVFDFNNNLKREIYFEPTARTVTIFGFSKEMYDLALDNIRIIDLKNDGHCSFISENSIDGLTVYDNQGNISWKYGQRDIDAIDKKSEAERDKEVYITKVDIGDLNDDGINEFIISTKNEGIRAFDINKNEVWFQPDEFPIADFYVIDIDGDSKTDLVGVQGASRTIRDKSTGNIIKKISVESGRKRPLILEDFNKHKGIYFFDIYKNKLKFSDLYGKDTFEIETPLGEIKVESSKEEIETDTPPPITLSNGIQIRAQKMESSYDNYLSIYEPKAVWVKLQKDKPKYLAVIGSFIGIPRSNFYVYDEKGNLVYHELLPEDAETIVVVPQVNGIDEILVAGKNTIWRFNKKDSN